MTDFDEATKHKIVTQINKVRASLRDFSRDLSLERSAANLEKVSRELARLEEITPGGTPATDIESFFRTVGDGIVAAQTTLDERRYESALLRTFGARRRTVLAGIAAEFAALGLAAGIFAALGASLIGGLAATQLFNLDYEINPMLWLIGTLAGVAVVGISGVVAARSAVNTPPVRTLRHM